MQVSIRASMRPAWGSSVHPLRWAFEEAARLGFDGLELNMRADQFSLAPMWTEEGKETVKAMIKEFGVSVLSLSSDWAWSYALFYPDLKDWGRGVEVLAADAKLASELGAHTILMHFGTGRGSRADRKALLQDAAAVGAENGITFGFEANIWSNTGQGSFDDLLEMANEIDSPGFGVYLHNSYPRAGLPLQEEIVKAGDRLVQAMHSSDLNSDRVEIDWAKAIPAMKQYFANGAYTFEVSWDVAEANKKVIDEAIAKYW